MLHNNIRIYINVEVYIKFINWWEWDEFHRNSHKPKNNWLSIELELFLLVLFACSHRQIQNHHKTVRLSTCFYLSLFSTTGKHQPVRTNIWLFRTEKKVFKTISFWKNSNFFCGERNNDKKYTKKKLSFFVLEEKLLFFVLCK